MITISINYDLWTYLQFADSENSARSIFRRRKIFLVRNVPKRTDLEWIWKHRLTERIKLRNTMKQSTATSRTVHFMSLHRIYLKTILLNLIYSEASSEVLPPVLSFDFETYRTSALNLCVIGRVRKVTFTSTEQTGNLSRKWVRSNEILGCF